MTTIRPDNHANTLTILLGFGGSGAKTVCELAKLLTNDPESARFAHERVHVVLCDTDEGDLRRAEREIAAAFDSKCPGLKLQVDTFSLSSNSYIFSDLVQSKIDNVSDDGKSRLRQNWWFQDGEVPFSATGLPLSTSAGAGQCPLVSHFLAWEKLDQFPELLSRIDAYARNHRHMEDFSIDLVMVAGLAGGTGRGCWQALALKAREHFGRNGQACRPYGFFFDQSVFEYVKRGRPEQKVKLQINSLTGLSELAMWLRSDKRMPGEPTVSAGNPIERRFSLPGLEYPDNPQLDAIDTERYMPERQVARVGRSPIHKAYVFTNESSSMHLEDARSVYELAGAAIFGRILVSQTRSSDANQPARAATTATSVLYVPANDIRNLIADSAKALRAARILEGQKDGMPVAVRAENGTITVRNEEISEKINRLAGWMNQLLAIPSVDDLATSSPELPSIFARMAENYHSERSAATAARGRPNPLRDAIRLGDEARVKSLLSGSMKTADAVIDSRFLEGCLGCLLGPTEDAGDARAALDEARKNRQNPYDVLVDRIAAILASTHGDSIQKTSAASDGSLAVVVAAAAQLLKRAQDLKKACSEQKSEAEQRGSSSAEAIAAEVKKSVRPWAKIAATLLFWLPIAARRIPRISGSRQKTLLAQVAKSRISADHAQILHCYQSLLEKLCTQLAVWKENAEEAASVTSRVRVGLDKQCGKGVGDLFTDVAFDKDTRSPERAKMLEMLQRLQRDEDTPVTRMLRRLRPVYDESEFRQRIEQTLSERGAAAYEQELFFERLVGNGEKALASDQSVFYSPARAGVSERHRFRGATEDGLLSLLARQDASDSAVEGFTLRRVLVDLMHLWIAAYEANQGDERFCRELDRVVSRITGISIDRLFEIAADDKLRSESARVPGEADLVAHAALMLAKCCDPLVRMPTSTSSGGDLVSIFVPYASLKSGKDDTREICQEIDRIWRTWEDHFHHVRASGLSDNPFMMIATSDHPKRDFDQNGWSGWSSFDYHFLETDLADWLDFVEDPTGKSIFLQGRDDSIGLGYLHPAYVRDPHWARRRWRPWFNENRQKTQDRRKWEALAYSLLGNQLYEVKGKPSPADLPFFAPYRELCDKIRATAALNPNYPTEKITLPLLLEEAGGGGPVFTRAIFRNGSPSMGIRPNDKNLQKSEIGKSVRSFMEWFKSDASREVLDEIWHEQCLLMRVLSARDDEFYDVLSPDHRVAVRKTLHEYVDRWKTYIENSTTRQDDCEEQVAFLDEFERVVADQSFDVLNPFDGVEAAR